MIPLQVEKKPWYSSITALHVFHWLSRPCDFSCPTVSVCTTAVDIHNETTCTIYKKTLETDITDLLRYEQSDIEVLQQVGSGFASRKMRIRAGMPPYVYRRLGVTAEYIQCTYRAHWNI